MALIMFFTTSSAFKDEPSPEETRRNEARRAAMAREWNRELEKVLLKSLGLAAAGRNPKEEDISAIRSNMKRMWLSVDENNYKMLEKLLPCLGAGTREKLIEDLTGNYYGGRDRWYDRYRGVKGSIRYRAEFLVRELARENADINAVIEAIRLCWDDSNRLLENVLSDSKINRKQDGNLRSRIAVCLDETGRKHESYGRDAIGWRGLTQKEILLIAIPYETLRRLDPQKRDEKHLLKLCEPWLGERVRESMLKEKLHAKALSLESILKELMGKASLSGIMSAIGNIASSLQKLNYDAALSKRLEKMVNNAVSGAIGRLGGSEKDAAECLKLDFKIKNEHGLKERFEYASLSEVREGLAAMEGMLKHARAMGAAAEKNKPGIEGGKQARMKRKI